MLSETRHLLWLSLLGMLIAGGSLVAICGYLTMVVVVGVVNSTPIVDRLFDIAVPALLGIGSMIAVLGLSGVVFVYSLFKMASLPRSNRLATVFDLAESHSDTLRSFGLADLVRPPRPTPEEQIQQELTALKRRYVEGELTEAEFERQLDQLVTTDQIDRQTAVATRRQTTEADR